MGQYEILMVLTEKYHSFTVLEITISALKGAIMKCLAKNKQCFH